MKTNVILTIQESDLFKAFLTDIGTELQQLPEYYLLEAADITVSGNIYVLTKEGNRSYKVWTRIYTLDAENLLNTIKESVLRDLESQQLPEEIIKVDSVWLSLGPAYAWTEEEVFSLMEGYCEEAPDSYWTSLPRNPQRPCSCYL